MNIKPRHKRRFFWSIVVLIGISIICLVCIPPFINLNKMKPILEQKVYEQTGIQTKINGNINFSLLGVPTIVAHNIQIPTGKFDTLSFSVPFRFLFNIKNATLNNEITVNNGNIKITDLFPYNTPHKINLYNVKIDFMNHDYKIVRGTLSNKQFSGQIRTQQHKYDITYNNGEFIILNSNDNLHIRGTLFPNGGAAGEMSIATNNINKWFEFENPKISEPVNLTTDFNWDGEYGFDFFNIHANNYTGEIKLLPNGLDVLNFQSNTAKLDITFISYDKTILNKSNINFDLSGAIKFKQNIFKKFMIIAAGRNNTLELNHVIADNIELFGGTYDNNGLHNTKLQINNMPEKFSCNFSGTPNKWECKNFKYGNISGNITTDNGIFKISATSTGNTPSIKTIQNLIKNIGENGTIDFTFADKSGTFVVTPKQIIPKFNYAKNVTLSDINFDIKFLPDFMKTSIGTYTSQKNKKTFIPNNKQWTIDVVDNNFTITGQNFKQWLPNTDLRFLKNLPYAISGTSSNDTIGDLHIMIADQILSGSVTKSGITLQSNELNIDELINPYFKENYSEQKFLTNHPLATLFDLPINISISSDTLIFENQEYKNFVYSLKPETQIFSISDNDRGNLLGIIEKKKNEYDISIQLNKFKTDGEFLKSTMPLNIANSTITAEIDLHTSGQTANDLIYNLAGTMDMTFIGGEIIGFGFDKFYASAEQITILNAEYALASALESGITKIKKLKITGNYKNGNFETTKPFIISMRHVDGVGALFINNNIMTGTFEFVMRGIAPQATNIELNLNESGRRTYSMMDVINNMDIGFMRAFIRTNNKF